MKVRQQNFLMCFQIDKLNQLFYPNNPFTDTFDMSSFDIFLKVCTYFLQSNNWRSFFGSRITQWSITLVIIVASLNGMITMWSWQTSCFRIIGKHSGISFHINCTGWFVWINFVCWVQLCLVWLQIGPVSTELEQHNSINQIVHVQSCDASVWNWIQVKVKLPAGIRVWSPAYLFCRTHNHLC